MTITFLMALLPLMAVLGSAALWGLLPFGMGALALTWALIRRNIADGALSEVLTIWPERVALERCEPRGVVRSWEANPYWVTPALHETGGPVDAYVTLKGGGREVEIGAFLSPDERRALYAELTRRLPARGA